MDNEVESIGILFLIIIAFTFFIVLFCYNYYNLYRFKKCYDINFQSSKCQRYLNY